MKTLKDVTCLIVDDDEMILEILGTALRRRFKEVYGAKDGVEGFEKYQDLKPDCVITDIEMPKMNGKKLLELIKNDNPSEPVIIVTAFEDEVVGIDSANAILLKPTTPKEICSTIEGILGL